MPSLQHLAAGTPQNNAAGDGQMDILEGTSQLPQSQLELLGITSNACSLRQPV